MKSILFALALVSLSSASMAAGVDDACRDLEFNEPEDYNEQLQQDFLQNYYALSSSFSGVHGPIPQEAGEGSLGVQLNGLVPLPCKRRLALYHRKTEDTNKSPVIPTVVGSFTFDALGDSVHPYAEVGFLPPLPVAGTRTLVFQAAGGVGMEVSDSLDLGVRAHASIQRTVGEVATPLEEGAPAYEDLYLGSTFGFQGLFGISASERIRPFAMVGVLDVSSFFYVGDTGVVSNNMHPYLGPEYAIGSEFEVHERLKINAEYYAAPGGRRVLDGLQPVAGFSAYGRVHTLRLRLLAQL